jgi:hypothetical protein
MSHPCEFRRQLPHALAGPPQWRLGVPTRHGFHQRLQIPLQGRIRSAVRFRPAPSRRIRCGRGSFGAAFSSAMPRITVPRDKPLARAAMLTPPKPRASASAAATSRRVRSSSTPVRDSNTRASGSASGIKNSIEHFRPKLFYLFRDSSLAQSRTIGAQLLKRALRMGVSSCDGFTLSRRASQLRSPPGKHEEPRGAQNVRRAFQVAKRGKRLDPG